MSWEGKICWCDSNSGGTHHINGRKEVLADSSLCTVKEEEFMRTLWCVRTPLHVKEEEFG